MKSFRLTLISDATKEYPENQNNSFKVRLPVRLNLEGNNWQASLWSMSVPDEGHSYSVIESDEDTEILKFSYTLSLRWKDSSDWKITFKSKESTVKIKDVMNSDYPVWTGQQLWTNIVTDMEKTMMEDVKVSSDAWKTTKGNWATVSLKKTWKPRFEWQNNTLVMKKVAREDVFARDEKDGIALIPLSSVGIQCSFAQKFGLATKKKDGTFELGPNLDYELPTVTYSTDSYPKDRNSYYQWLGEHFVGIKPRDIAGNKIFKVKKVNGKSYLFLSRAVDWYFNNLNGLFNTHVGTIRQSVMVYCDAVETTVVGEQRHSLLRKVELERKGEGRATVEPFHREWIRVRNHHIESIEVSLATPSGELLILPPGKTILTLGFQQV